MQPMYQQHLRGRGDGLGIAPLTDDGLVRFCAIDLDAPDFELAVEMAMLLPGHQWIEKSRSGNAHVFSFFSEPLEAWVARGIMRECLAALDKKHVEVFPKQDLLREGMLGNYINLPYFGDTRPMVWCSKNVPVIGDDLMLNLEASLGGLFMQGYPLSAFLANLESTLNDPADWRKRARWLGVVSPEERKASGRHEFGTQPNLHMCAEHVIAERDNNPISAGHLNVVLFAVAKQLTNCAQFDDDEAYMILGLVNESAEDPANETELSRIFQNAASGRFTSTGCDDPLFLPYANPKCPIANG